MAKTYTTGLVITGDASGGIRAVHATRDEIKRLDAQTARSARTTRTAAASMERSYAGVASSLATARTAVLALGAGAVLNKTISAFADFEKGLIGVGKTTNIAGAELDSIGQKIQELSGRVPVATTQLLEIAQSAGQLGVKGSANILRFTETVAKLGTSTDLVGEEAASSFARLLTVTGEPIRNVDRLGAAVVALGNNFAATESEITGVSTRVAQSTAQFDVGVANVLGISTALKAVGVEAEAGGTQIGLAFQSINDAVRNGGKQMQILQRITGQTGDALREQFLGGQSAAVFQAFIEGLSRVREQGGDVTAVLDSMGLTGTRATQVLGTLATRSDVLADAIGQANKGWKDNVALNNEAAVAAQSVSAQWQIAQNRAASAAVAFGEIFKPAALKSLGAMQVGFGALAEHMDVVVQSGTVLAGLFVGRLTGSLVTATQGQIGAATAAVRLAAAERDTAAQTVRVAQAEAIAAERAVIMARAQVGLTQGTSAQAAALKTLNVTTRSAIASRAALTEATLASSAANTTYARTASGAALAARGLSTAMGVLGGPVGVAVLAASALYSFRHELLGMAEPSRKAEAALDEYTDSIDRNSKAALNNGLAHLRAELAKTEAAYRSVHAQAEKLSADRAPPTAGRSPMPGFNAEGLAKTLEANDLKQKADAQRAAIDELEKSQKDLAAALRGDTNGGGGQTGGGNTGGDEGTAALLNEYDANTVKLRKLQADRAKLVEAMGSAAPENLRRYKTAVASIDDEIANLGKTSKKTAAAGATAAQQLESAYQSAASQLAEQVTLFDSTGQAAQTRYQLEHGELSAVSDARAANLLSMAQELDALNAQKEAVKALFPEFEQLDRIKSLQQQTANLPPELQTFGKRRAAQMLQDTATEGLPQGPGLDAQYSGAFGEASRLEDDRAKYEEKYQQRLDAFRAYAATHKEEAAQVNQAIEALDRDHQSRMLSYDRQTQKARMAGYEDLYGSVTDIVGTFAGEQSAIYKTMFAGEKAYHIASVLMNSTDAIAKAWASAPFPANLPAVATTAVETGALQAAISGVGLSGQAHAGMDNIPREGTWLLDRGERVVDQRTNGDLKQYLQREKGGATKRGGDVVFAPNITVQAQQGVSDKDAQAQGRELYRGLRQQFEQFVLDEKRPGGLLEGTG